MADAKHLANPFFDSLALLVSKIVVDPQYGRRGRRQRSDATLLKLATLIGFSSSAPALDEFDPIFKDRSSRAPYILEAVYNSPAILVPGTRIEKVS